MPVGGTLRKTLRNVMRYVITAQLISTFGKMNKDICKLLIKDIQTKVGKEIRYGKDCKKLSEQIAKETGRQISDSTMKRFFGIVKSPFNPSKYTLDTFVSFMGFENWSDYLNTYDQSKHASGNEGSWNYLKKRVMLVTNHSLHSLKQKTSYHTEKLIARPFAGKKLEAFMESQKVATMFVAPDGYGKSTNIIQLVENYFLKEDAKYKDDIVFLIDGGIFFNLYSKNINFDLLAQLLEFKINSSLVSYFEQKPEERKGHLLMIIDNVDEIFFDKDRYHKFIENLMRLIMGHENGWYKTLLTCRPENLGAFSYQIKKNPYLKKFWYDMDFESSNLNDNINIPLFSRDEIDGLFNKNQLEYDCNALEKKNKNVFKIIRYPRIFNLFVKQYKKKHEISEVALLHSFINERIYTQPFSEEKVTLIDTMIELCEYGKETSSVKKDSLFTKTKSSKLAYNDLLSYGIIYEYTVPNGLLGNTTYVKFNHSLIFEYLLLLKWSQNRPMDVELFYTLKEYYTNNIQLQCTLLILFVRMLKHEKKTEVLEQLQTLFKTSQPTNTQEQSSCLGQVVSILNNAIEEPSNKKYA
jgi:hypothetical protein